MNLSRILYKSKYSKVLACLFLMISFSFMVSISYAFYTFYAVQEDDNVVLTDCFKLVITNNNDILLNNALPIKESAAQDLVPHTFTIKNVCNQAQNYDVTIEDLSSSTLPLEHVRFQLDNDASHILSDITPNQFKILDDANNSRTIRTSIIMPNEEFTYSLRMWIDENAPKDEIENKSLRTKIVITSNMNRNPYKIITLLPGEGYLESNTLNIVDGRLVGYLPTPQRNGFTFNGWFDNLENQVTEFTQVTTNMDLYAHYNRNSYTLEVNPNTGTWDGYTSVQYYNLMYEDTKNINNPVKNGYTFDGWTVEGAGSSLENNTFKMGYEDTTLTANYHINTHKLTIENSYTCDGEYYLDYNTTKEICTPQRDGYTFDGWTITSGDLTNNVYTIEDSDATLTANWVLNAYKWIAYHRLQEIGGNSYKLVNADTDEGYALFGTNVTPTVNTYTGFISPNAITLTIQVENAYPPTTNVVNYQYERFKGTLTIDPNEGVYSGNTTNEDIYYEQKVNINTPSKACHTFSNWTINGANSKLVDNQFTMGTEDATLTANYNIIQNVITYDANGGSIENASDTANCGTSITLPKPTREGYSFTGWYEDPISNEDKIGDDGDQIIITKSKTIYAHWTIRHFTITYNGNGGTPTRLSDVDKDYGMPLILPNASRNQTETHTYTLDGWYTQEEGGEKVGNAGELYIVKDNQTLYAHWTENSRT